MNNWLSIYRVLLLEFFLDLYLLNPGLFTKLFTEDIIKAENTLIMFPCIFNKLQL